jgi:hypothetical protein
MPSFLAPLSLFFPYLCALARVGPFLQLIFSLFIAFIFQLFSFFLIILFKAFLSTFYPFIPCPSSPCQVSISPIFTFPSYLVPIFNVVAFLSQPFRALDALFLPFTFFISPI